MDSGPDPTNSCVSPTTVLGTDEMWYFIARSENPVTSTPSAVIWSLSIANLKARRTARGQYGQVGVEKTLMWTSLPRMASDALVSSASAGSPVETRIMESIRLLNS